MKIRETHRVVVLGGGGVGKTCLVTQFMEGYFVNSYKATVEDYYRHTVKTPDGRIHTVEIVDTSGTHVFPAMRELSIRSAKAVVIVFALDDPKSLTEVTSLFKLVRKVRGEVDIPVILVGNKSDASRQITLESVLQAKSDWGKNVPYIETSAKYNVNVTKLFLQLLQEANRHDEDGTPEFRRRKFSRRLSSFSSLPNISLIRRKSNGPSSNQNKGHQSKAIKQASEDSTYNSSNSSSPFMPKRFFKKQTSASSATSGCASALPSVKGVEELIANNISNVNCLVDEGFAEIRRVVINGIDTISLSDGRSLQPEGRCVIL